MQYSPESLQPELSPSGLKIRAGRVLARFADSGASLAALLANPLRHLKARGKRIRIPPAPPPPFSRDRGA
jgi:hypothetical protein